MRRLEVAILRADLVDEPWSLPPAVLAGLDIRSDDLEAVPVVPAVRTCLGPSCETQVSMIPEDHPVVADVGVVASSDEIDRNIPDAHGDP